MKQFHIPADQLAQEVLDALDQATLVNGYPWRTDGSRPADLVEKLRDYDYRFVGVSPEPIEAAIAAWQARPPE